MFAEERRLKILNMLDKSQRIEVGDLVKVLQFSKSTIRRDLQDLEEAGLLKRTHGGAVKINMTSFEPTMDEKELDRLEEKRAIGRIGAGLIQNHDTILLDSGTTTLQIAKNLKAKNVLVLTNSILIAKELSGKDVRIILIGGELRQETMAIVGSAADEMLRRVRVDKAFLGANGITLKDGCTTPNLQEAITKRHMISAAKEVYVVADHSKFEKIFFFQYAEPEKIHTIVTDWKINREVVGAYGDRGIPMIFEENQG